MSGCSLCYGLLVCFSFSCPKGTVHGQAKLLHESTYISVAYWFAHNVLWYWTLLVTIIVGLLYGMFFSLPDPPLPHTPTHQPRLFKDRIPLQTNSILVIGLADVTYASQVAPVTPLVCFITRRPCALRCVSRLCQSVHVRMLSPILHICLLSIIALYANILIGRNLFLVPRRWIMGGYTGG